MFQLCTFLFGLVIGSFLSVCIFRIPYGREKGPGDFSLDAPDEGDTAAGSEVQPEGEKLTIFYPARSFCPHCRTQLRWFHNIPLFSWLFLRGRCGFCGAKIPAMYPMVELLSALSCLWAFQLFDPPTAAVVYIFSAALIVLSFIDAEYYILPNVITFPGMALGIGVAAVNQFWQPFTAPVVPDLMWSFWGLLAGGGFLFAVSEIYYLVRKRIGLGFGDVKLLAMTGLLFGPEVAIGTIFMGSLVGAVGGGLALLISGNKLSKPLPFGPYLALGTFLCIYLGIERLLQGYGYLVSLLLG